MGEKDGFSAGRTKGSSFWGQPLKTEGKFSHKLVVILQKTKALGNIPEDLQKKNMFQKAEWRELGDLHSSNPYLGTGKKASKHVRVIYMGKERKKRILKISQDYFFL